MMDPYFTAKPKKASRTTPLMLARWKEFQRLSHKAQADVIDRMITDSRYRKLGGDEAFIVRQWELKRSPWII